MSSVPLGEAARDREAEAAAVGAASLGMDAMERLEDPLEIGGCDARATAWTSTRASRSLGVVRIVAGSTPGAPL